MINQIFARNTRNIIMKSAQSQNFIISLRHGKITPYYAPPKGEMNIKGDRGMMLSEKIVFQVRKCDNEI